MSEANNAVTDLTSDEESMSAKLKSSAAYRAQIDARLATMMQDRQVLEEQVGRIVVVAAGTVLVAGLVVVGIVVLRRKRRANRGE